MTFLLSSEQTGPMAFPFTTKDGLSSPFALVLFCEGVRKFVKIARKISLPAMQLTWA